MAEPATWIVVADAGRARLFRYRGLKQPLEPALDYELVHDTRRSREIASDRQGRGFDEGGEGRHGLAPGTDPHRYEQQRFARELAELLETQHNQGEFQRLVLVASPGMLGDLRASLSGRLRKLVYKEEAKDLTRLETDPLSQRVQALMQPF